MNGLVVVLALFFAGGPQAKRQDREQTPTPQAEQSGRRGLTFGKNSEDAQLRTVFVSCHGQPRPEGGDCNPHVGDTPCTTSLPVLCLKVDGSPRPPYPVVGKGHAMPKQYYQGWAEGQVGVTRPVAGVELTSEAAATALCQRELGPGYRMAEFHDGKYFAGMGEQSEAQERTPWSKQDLRTGGWAYHAYGKVPSGTRFWVRINDQAANCWDGPKPASKP